MQTSETGSDTGSTVTLQTSVASQAAVPTQVVQQVPVQQQVKMVQQVCYLKKSICNAFCSAPSWAISLPSSWDFPFLCYVGFPVS
ncbi:hypothetical protein FD755_019625 [Muntiacus reevesi]|uniref:RFX1 transcription activation region domain-containing protein n=2 Tax=Muntiacus TaxID=9885 RepID=A0A5N3X349_MUNRE|nr:hypothetical protein FD754_002497 [Muntiacus muntjak]KAB0368591.1 hypothetical protein FD755_019625 [Muntiacus reevesi]